MTTRERILAVLDGRLPDRLPWIPRLSIWYEANRRAGTLPDRYRDKSLREVEREVFGGTAAREGVIYRTEIPGVEIRTHHLGEMDTVVEYITPVGTVTSELRGTKTMRTNGIQDAEVGFPLKRIEDYPVVEYLIEHTESLSAYEEYEVYEQGIGEDGYPMVNCGDCPFHHWMRALVGYNRAFYHLNDHTTEVERLLRLITDKYRQTVWRHMLESPARLVMHGHHLSSMMTPPPLFDQYILPYYRELTPKMRERGKIVALHGDNDTRQILRHIERAGFGMVECFATAPMVPTTLSEARAAWGDRVIIFGGVPSVILEEPFTDQQFDAYMDDLFDTIAPGGAYLLGIADNAMPGSKIERIERISQRIRDCGELPLPLPS